CRGLMVNGDAGSMVPDMPGPAIDGMPANAIAKALPSLMIGLLLINCRRRMARGSIRTRRSRPGSARDLPQHCGGFVAEQHNYVASRKCELRNMKLFRAATG